MSGTGLTNPAVLLGRFLRENRSRFKTNQAFAYAIACSPGRLSQILNGGMAMPRVRPALAVAIHRVTGGFVPGNVLRPDLWRKPADVPVEWTNARQ